MKLYSLSQQMVNNENIDISEYNRLKDENATLRTILRRYLIFGEYGKFNNLESDLSDQLHYAENLNAKLFDNSLAATFCVLCPNGSRIYYRA